METASEKIDQLAKLRSQVELLDSQFSLFGFRFGVDALLGLIPGLGDILGGFISLLIVLRMRSIGISDAVLNKMLINVLIDTFVGGVPVIGDLFDFFYKTNERNFRLAMQDITATQHQI
jgi:hypothetical protein